MTCDAPLRYLVVSCRMYHGEGVSRLPCAPCPLNCRCPRCVQDLVPLLVTYPHDKDVTLQAGEWPDRRNGRRVNRWCALRHRNVRLA